jgi:phage terminase small subunit
MTPKRRAFCEKTIKNPEDPATNYLEAGFTSKDRLHASKLASRMLKNADVKEYVSERRAKIEAEIEKQTGISVQWVLDSLKANHDRAMQLEPVCDKEGNGIGFKYDGAVANRSLELMGKHLGMFVERVENKTELVGNVHVYLPAAIKPREGGE